MKINYLIETKRLIIRHCLSWELHELICGRAIDWQNISVLNQNPHTIAFLCKYSTVMNAEIHTLLGFFRIHTKKISLVEVFFSICFVWDTEEAKKSSKSKINRNSITPFQHIIISKCNKIPEQKKEERNESE